jgi:hypothetical protein
MSARIQKISAGSFALAISTVLSPVWAADPIVGTWRLVSWTEEETEGKAIHKNFGDQPNGLLTLTADDRMMLIMTDPSRKPPSRPRATDTEAVELYRTMVAYAGRYKTEGDKLIYYPEIDTHQEFNGTEQVRFFKINGDHMQYDTSPFVCGISGSGWSVHWFGSA